MEIYGGLYPTFKEWKRTWNSRSENFSSRLYPTFKEWKLRNLDISYPMIVRLYPTFKEWKPIKNGDTLDKICVYILPLRNENTASSYAPQRLWLAFISYL